MLAPGRHHLLIEAFIELVAVRVGKNNSLEVGGVGHRLDARLVVLDQVVIALQSSTLLVLNNDFPHLQEEIVDGRVLCVPLGGAIDSAGTLEDLQD